MKRFKFWVPLLGFLVLCVIFAIALFRAPENQIVKSALIDKPMPEFSLPDLLNPGQTLNAAMFKGKWLLVNVWGTWCIECRKEHQMLLDIKNAGKVVILGLDYQDEDDKARQWLMDLGNPYTAVGVDREGRTGIDFGVYGAPENFLVNPEGIIVHKLALGITPEIWRDEFLPLIDGSGA
jgi:cytochrome c biogenesis protein CcmG/thiol:disulfide interchange protein DsbE